MTNGHLGICVIMHSLQVQLQLINWASTVSTELLEGHRKLQAAIVTTWNSEITDSVCTADSSGGIGPTRQSLVIPSVHGLGAQLAAIKAKYNCKMVRSLKKSAEHRLSAYEEQTLFQLAATLDPCFKLAWCEDKRDKS